MPYSASQTPPQQQHEPALEALSYLERSFPHLEFSSIVARINTSLARDDHGYHSMYDAAPTNSDVVEPDDSESSPDEMEILRRHILNEEIS